MTMLADPLAGTVRARSGLLGRVRAGVRAALADSTVTLPAVDMDRAVRDASVAWMTFMGIPQGDGIDAYSHLEDFANAPADEAWVFACINRFMAAAASVPFRVYVKAGKELLPAEEAKKKAAAGAADLQYLLDNANPVDMTGAELRAYCVASRKAWGGWYLKRVAGKFGGVTQELYWLRVPDVKPHSDDGRTIDWYDVSAKNQPTAQFKPDQLIRKRGLNLRSQVEMESPLSAARYDMIVGSAAPQQTAAILKNRGVPEGYWVARQGTEVSRQDTRSIRAFIRSLKGPRNAGKSLISPDIEFKALTLPEKDAEWLQARRVSRMTVCAVLGMPLALAGDVENTGFYRSVLDAERVWWKDSNVPELNGDAEALNNWLVPEFGNPNLVIAPDFSSVEALKPVWKDEWTGWLDAMDHQAITGNQFRRHFRLGEDLPWGDKPTPKTQVTLRPDPTTLAGIDLPIATTETAPSAPESPAIVEEPGGTTGDEPDLPASLRAFGKRLYSQLAVRAFIAHGGPLDTRSLLGVTVTGSTRQVIEDGIRRRQSAVQIAVRLAEGSFSAQAGTDVSDAVMAALRKQWPERELAIVHEGRWRYDPNYPVANVHAARRPIARNPKIVDGIVSALKVGAPIDPVVLIDLAAVNRAGTEPIDGWHRMGAVERVGRATVPAYIGTGDEEWTRSLLAFDDDIPTPLDSAPRSADVTGAEGFMAAVRSLAEPPVVNIPAPIVNIPAPVVNVPAPVVNVPAPIVNVPAPDLSGVEAAMRDLQEEVRRPRIRTLVRDDQGKAIGAVDAPSKEKP